MSLRRRYDIVKLTNHLETLLKGTGISCIADPEKNEVTLMDWIQGEMSPYKTDTIILKSDLTYRFSEYVDGPDSKEVPMGVNIVTSTTREEQAKYATRQHTLYRLQQAMSCCILA